MGVSKMVFLSRMDSKKYRDISMILKSPVKNTNREAIRQTLLIQKRNLHGSGIHD